MLFRTVPTARLHSASVIRRSGLQPGDDRRRLDRFTVAARPLGQPPYKRFTHLYAPLKSRFLSKVMQLQLQLSGNPAGWPVQQAKILNRFPFFHLRNVPMRSGRAIELRFHANLRYQGPKEVLP